jgi:hypothetical protein
MGVILSSMPHDGHHQTIATPLRFGWSITAKYETSNHCPESFGVCGLFSKRVKRLWICCAAADGRPDAAWSAALARLLDHNTVGGSSHPCCHRLDHDTLGGSGQRCCHRFAAAGSLLGWSLARRQYRDLMRGGRHSGERKRNSGRLFLSVGRSQRHKLVGRDRKAHDFISWQFCSLGRDCARHEGCDGCDRQSIQHGDSDQLKMAKNGLSNCVISSDLFPSALHSLVRA